MSSSASSSKTHKTRKAPKRWEDDGGEMRPSSIDILINWLTTGVNYARWKGNSEGTTKEALCGEIVGLMKAAGITHCNNTDIRTKISELQTSYNKARDW